MGNLSTPKSVQKLQTALHAKAKAEASYRSYALYDKISREVAEIDAYGVERWLCELAQPHCCAVAPVVALQAQGQAT